MGLDEEQQPGLCASNQSESRCNPRIRKQLGSASACLPAPRVFGSAPRLLVSGPHRGLGLGVRRCPRGTISLALHGCSAGGSRTEGADRASEKRGRERFFLLQGEERQPRATNTPSFHRHAFFEDRAKLNKQLVGASSGEKASNCVERGRNAGSLDQAATVFKATALMQSPSRTTRSSSDPAFTPAHTASRFSL